MQPTSMIARLAIALTTGLLVAWAFAPGASAQLQPGDILVVDPDSQPLNAGVLFQVDPQTGARTVLSNFGAGSPSAVAVEADGGILVTDTAAGTDPSGGTSEWGVLYRLSPDPLTGDLIRSVLTDFGVGPDTGRNPRAVAIEADGRILVTTGRPGTLNDRPLLVRVDPVTGARTIVSDFRDSDQGVLGIEPRGIAIEASGAILVIDAQGGPNALGELFRINPQTGFRTSVSRFNTPVLGASPTSVAVEATGRILVTDEGPGPTPLGLLFRIDPQSGLRTVLSDFNTGANTGREPAGVAIEADGQILVVDRHAGIPGAPPGGLLFRIDPQTGARTIVSDFAAGLNRGSEPLALAVVPPTQGELVVVNEIVNDNGGTAVVSDWTTIVTGGNPMPASFPGAGPPGTTVTLDPGAYSTAVVRGGPAGYLHTSSPGCDGTIAAGETKTCTVTHDDQPATLLVMNEVVNDNGGTAIAADWTVAVTGTNPAPATFPSTGSPGTMVTLDAGAYTVSPNGPDGYTSTLSADCAGTIAVGESKTCTITNDDKPATLVVIIEVVNDNGGSAGPGDVAVTVTGGNPSPASFQGTGAPGTTVTLDAGIHWVDVAGPPGYGSLIPSPACAGTIAAGETKTCTVVFDDFHATLVVIEEVVNDDGGSAVAGDFSVTVTGGDPSPASFPGAGAFGTSVTLDAGSYSVDVSGPPGYTSTLSPGCAATIGLAELKFCTITSDDEPATLIVVNEVFNHDVGTALPSDWTVTVTGANPVPGTFPGADGPGTAVTLGAGAYSVSASGPAGYSSFPSADCAGTIASGQTRTCTIGHEAQLASLLVSVDVVNDNGGTAVAADWTIAVTGGNPTPASFPGAQETTVTLLAVAYLVSESGPDGYSSSFSPGCSGTIAPGGMKFCTVTIDDHPPGVPTCDGKLATIVAAPGQSLVVGTPRDDVIVALGDSHSVYGRDGSDTICTGTDFDLIEGGPGDDTIIDAGWSSTGKGDTVRGEAGNDTISTGGSNDRIDGGSGNDTINSGGGDDVVDGQGGDDTIGTAAGNDRVDGGLGHDAVTDTDGHNVVLGNAGNDAITTGAGNDRIEAGSGNDVVDAGEGANQIDGQADADTMTTGAGNDEIDGGPDVDTITDSGGRNTVQGRDGDDVITTGDGTDAIGGGGGNDLIDAGGGNNSINGADGDDTILAGAGNDLIDGGRGFDACTPGGGLDTIWRCEVVT